MNEIILANFTNNKIPNLPFILFKYKHYVTTIDAQIEISKHFNSPINIVAIDSHIKLYGDNYHLFSDYVKNNGRNGRIMVFINDSEENCLTHDSFINCMFNNIKNDEHFLN